MTQPTPQGYKKRGIDVVGYWNPELGQIHCKPLAAKIFDGNIDKTKPSTLLIVQLLEPCSAVTMKGDDEDEDPELVETKEGDMVGVWGKPGMAAIKTLAGEPCIIRYELDDTGAIKTKRMKKRGMNPMKCFEVLSARNPMKVIPIVEDARRESAHMQTMLAAPKQVKPASAPAPTGAPEASPDEDGDIPF